MEHRQETDCLTSEAVGQMSLYLFCRRWANTWNRVCLDSHSGSSAHTVSDTKPHTNVSAHQNLKYDLLNTPAQRQMHELNCLLHQQACKSVLGWQMR